MVEAAKAAFSVANVWVCSLVQVFNISRVFAILTFGVLFVIQKHGYEPAAAGGVVGLGLVGEVIGALSIGFIVDRINRTKLPLVIIMFVSGIFAIIFALLPAGTPLPMLIGSVFICTLFGGGAGPLSIGVIPAESLPSKYSPSAIGMTNFFGEFVGGGLLLIAAGAIARALGYQTMFVCVGVIMLLSMAVGLGLKETRRS